MSRGLAICLTRRNRYGLNRTGQPVVASWGVTPPPRPDNLACPIRQGCLSHCYRPYWGGVYAQLWPELLQPPSPRSICYKILFWGRNAPPQRGSPLIRAGGTQLKKSPSQTPQRLRKINRATFCKNPPFFWLYGGRQRGGRSSDPSNRVLNLSTLDPLAARPG